MSASIFECEGDDGFVGNNMQAIARNNLHISIENPWAGDSETGFGATTTIEMTPEQAGDLVKFLTDWLSRLRADGPCKHEAAAGSGLRWCDECEDYVR
jgi:hypothetical protein